MPRFRSRRAVDFVIVGSGAAGGVLARELARQGFNIVLLEQGPHRTAADFSHDEMDVMIGNAYIGSDGGKAQTFRHTPGDQAVVQPDLPPALYASMVGGSSVHMSGNYWRFWPSEFEELSRYGPVDGADVADWPIGYDELEPWYTRVERDIGVSGAPGPFDPHRSAPYPLPPMPVKSSGVLLETGARKLGLSPQVAPVAIVSKPYAGRPACTHCGFCLGFGCEMDAKSSTLATMIPQALATGHCELRTGCTACRLEVGTDGRVDRVVYFDADGRERAQRARSVILAANGAETPRLLLLSASAQFPDGLANSSGLVGRYLMFNSHAATHAIFPEPLNDYKSIQCTRIVLDDYETDPERGFFGGGGIDARPFLSATPIMYALMGLPPDTPSWGPGFKKALQTGFTHQCTFFSNGTSLPRPTNRVTLDPALRDRFGLPALRITYEDHPDDLALMRFFLEKTEAIADAAGAVRSWNDPVEPQRLGAHLLGTCRMGDNPERSVVDRWHRSHDVPNLFICDGSSLVSSGGGQPTMTIQALAFRAADKLGELARRNLI